MLLATTWADCINVIAKLTVGHHAQEHDICSVAHLRPLLLLCLYATTPFICMLTSTSLAKLFCMADKRSRLLSSKLLGIAWGQGRLSTSAQEHQVWFVVETLLHTDLV